MTAIYIMAQGEGSRWNTKERPDLPRYKQLSVINTVPNIVRTAWMCTHCDRLSRIKIVCGEELFHEIESYLPADVGHLTLQEPTGTIIHGILSLWKFFPRYHDVIILLGDVVFAHYPLMIYLHNDDSISCLYGRTGGNECTGKEAKEIFAVRFSSHHDLENNLSHPRLINFLNRTGGGKLWTLAENNIMPLAETPYSEYTDDIDSPEEYDKFYPSLYIHATRDDNEKKFFPYK